MADGGPRDGGVNLTKRTIPLALQDRVQFLTTPDEVDQFLAKNRDAAVFKAGTCYKTPEAYVHVQAHLEPREDLPLGIIRVVEARAASNRVAELTGVTHESPQLFFFKDGKAVFDRDNWDITSEAIAEAIEGHFTRV
jgi:bacillithiol system protein YtxJ